jgi:hypothetical protein
MSFVGVKCQYVCGTLLEIKTRRPSYICKEPVALCVPAISVSVVLISDLPVYLVVNVSYKFDPRYEFESKMRSRNGNTVNTPVLQDPLSKYVAIKYFETTTSDEEGVESEQIT